ncbi:MAG: SDR family NAD(P)-dependent oxidoreductase [Candidatus Limnocylindria bacterium]
MGLDLQGRRVLVTGASGGIGMAVARTLHGRGATVVVSARREELLQGLCAELGDRAEALPADLADSADVAALSDRAGAVDVLVANAGLPASGPLLGFEHDQIDRALDVNLRAPLHLARALAPAMVERGAGHLVFVSSLSGKTASRGSSIYSATKFGMRGFAIGLREDLAGTGVGVTTVFPGFIRDAGMFHDSATKLPSFVGTRTPEQVAEALARGIERGRLEVDVAPLPLRLGAAFGGLAPSLSSAVQRRLGGAELADEMARGQANKR